MHPPATGVGPGPLPFPPARPARRVVVPARWAVVALMAAAATVAVLGGPTLGGERVGAVQSTSTTAAGAGQAPPSTPVTVPATDVTAPAGGPVAGATPDIIPMPNSGQQPADAGERGGGLQSALFFTICGAIVLIGGLIWRDSRRARRRQGRLPVSEGR